MKRLLPALLAASVAPAWAEPAPTPAPSFAADPAVGSELTRTGDEIVIAGRMFHTGTPVKLWFDDGGYDGYATETFFTPFEERRWTPDSGLPPARYNDRTDRFGFREDLSEEEQAAVRDGWSLERLGEVVDQFVMHYDVCGTSAYCFKVLHDHRGLSVQFMLDADGTIYQTLDVAERAWHAAQANSRSVGIEIANIGAYPPDDAGTLEDWYARDDAGTRITFPDDRPLGHLDPDAAYRPARPEPVTGVIHGRELVQYDLTDAQYEALTRLTATLVRVLPKLENRYPQAGDGSVRTDLLSDEEWVNFSGLLAHWHLDGNKIDPGPAFDWDRLTRGVDQLLGD